MTNPKKFLCIGPGGKGCPCCFPPRGKRRGEFRAAKFASKREARKIIFEDSSKDG